MNATMEGLLARFSSMTLRSAVGMYRSGQSVTLVESARTPFGVRRTNTRQIELVEDARKADEALRALVGEITGGKGGKNLTVGIRPSAVTFLSEPKHEGDALEGDHLDHSAADLAGILIESVGVSVAKTKYLLTGKVRRSEVTGVLPNEDADAAHWPRYEPGPWAAWRASIHAAPLKPRRGVHLRYILGPDSGIAVVGNEKWPLAWQLLSWGGADKGEVLIQAYHLLTLYARRRLGIAQIDHVSVQGAADLEEGWGVVNDALGFDVEKVDGPEYGPDMIAFGLSLGALDTEGETLDLARSLQKPKAILAMVPWGEAGFLAALFLCMGVVLWHHSNELERELIATQRANATIKWAHNVPDQKLKAEQAALSKEVSPLQKFMRRELMVSEAVKAIGDVVQPKTWVESLQAADQIWEKYANKSLGERFVVVRYGAPIVSRGTVPPQIDEIVREMGAHEFFKTNLPQVKLADVNWKREGAATGLSMFTVVALPK